MHALLEQHIRQTLAGQLPSQLSRVSTPTSCLFMAAHEKGLSGQAALTPGPMKGVLHLKEAALGGLIACAVLRWLQQRVQWAPAHPRKLLCNAQPHETHVGICDCWQGRLLHLHMTHEQPCSILFRSADATASSYWTKTQGAFLLASAAASRMLACHFAGFRWSMLPHHGGSAGVIMEDTWTDDCLEGSLLEVGQQVPQIHQRVHRLQARRQCREGRLASRSEQHQLCCCCKQRNLLACVADNGIQEALVWRVFSHGTALQEKKVK